MEIFETKEFDNKFKSFLLNSKQFLKWALETGTASSQQVVGVLRTISQGQKAESVVSIFVATDCPLLGRAGTEQVHKVLKASKTVQTFSASDGSTKK